MDGLDLFDARDKVNQQLSASLKELRKSGTAYAQAEHDYKIVLRQNVLKLRADGEAVGLISLEVYGIEEVAMARLKRDIAKTVYEANQEAINVLKIQLKTIIADIEREWSTPSD